MMKQQKSEDKKETNPGVLRVALCVLYTQEKRILIQHRDGNAERYPRLWGFFGGRIEQGETPNQAVVREAKEKLGYTLRRPQLSITQEFWDEHGIGIKYAFITPYDARQEIHLQESAGFMWTDKDLTQFLPMTDHDRDLLRDIARLLEGAEKK